MTAKLGKTAAALLVQLQNKGRVVVCYGIERGAQGGKFRPYGRRDRAAALALVKAGLADVWSSDSRQHYRNGYASHATEMLITLPGKAYTQ
jgi:hypothetical protein